MSLRPSVACIVRSSLLQQTTREIVARMGYEEPTNVTAAFKKHFAVLPARPERRHAHPAGHAPWTRFLTRS
jgi:AraC-like DNA-binding protein